MIKLQQHFIPNKGSHDRKTAHSAIKGVYTTSKRKYPDQEKTFQNIFF